MKLKDLDFKKLGLTNKRKEFVASHYKRIKYKTITEEEAKKEFVRKVNKQGYVPFNIKSVPEQPHFRTDSITEDRYGEVGAFCMYFGKRNAVKIKSIEDNRTTFQLSYGQHQKDNKRTIIN